MTIAKGKLLRLADELLASLNELRDAIGEDRVADLIAAIPRFRAAARHRIADEGAVDGDVQGSVRAYLNSVHDELLAKQEETA